MRPLQNRGSASQLNVGAGSHPAHARIETLFLDASAAHPDRTALVAGSRELTFTDLTAAASRLAERMLATASRSGRADLRGARVAVIAPNGIELVVALLAVWQLEAVAVPLSSRFRERELTLTLADAEPALVLSVPAHAGYSFAELLARLAPSLPTIRATLLLDGADALEELGAPAERDWEPLDPGIAAILYTSGTTGVPKGALVTHERETVAARYEASVLDLTPDDRVALLVPATHAFGFTCLVAGICAGSGTSLVESSFSPRPLLDAIETGGGTVVHGSPALFTALLKARPEGLGGVRGFMAGASPSPNLIERLEHAEMGILNMYGLTETGAVASCRPDDPPHERHTTAGLPLPGFELRLASTQPGVELGELELHGPAVTAGYYRRPAETAEAFTSDGWFRTGDLATLAGGSLRIAGRAKELVNIGGFNVFPAEVEAVLLEHPDVAQAAVVGVPDERMGEALRAFVVPRAGSEPTGAALLGFARERIAGYKLPYAIKILPKLPLLSSGKPDRRALQAANLHPGDR
jgi:acyl-CoA synthetase (AMP-forming)/AMP-acid ligase II